MESYKSFEELECWKEGRKLRNFVKDTIISKLPYDEKYTIINQIRRSSRSIGTNVAEGYGRYFYQENIQFCRIARGSLTETLDLEIIVNDEGYINDKDLEKLRSLYSKTLLILNGYIKYLKKQKINSID